MPIHVTDHFAQMLDILSKTRRHTLRGPQIHRRPQKRIRNRLLTTVRNFMTQ